MVEREIRVNNSLEYGAKWWEFKRARDFFYNIVVVAPPVKQTKGLRSVRLWEKERVVSEGVKGEESSGSNCHTYSYPFNSKPRKLKTHASPCLSVGSSCLSTQILCHLSNKNICVFVSTFLVSEQLMKSPSTMRINLDKF
jgi:hypothetical protein